MKIKRLNLPIAQLSLMPDAERTFLLMAGHIQNELVSLNKIFAWCLSNKEPASRIESSVNGMQAFMIARLLAGKLNEGWQLVQRAYFKTKVSRELSPHLHESTNESLAGLKAYFNKKENIIFSVRNSFSFHYSQEEIARHWQEAASEPNFDFYVGNEYGNTFHQASEIAVSLSLLKSIDSNSISSALEKFLVEVQHVAGLFNNFLSGVMLVLLERCFGGSVAHLGFDEEVSRTRGQDEISIPFFYVPPKRETEA